MKYLIAIWVALDGRKTNIAAGIGVFVWLISTFNSLVLVGYWKAPGIPHIDAICLTLIWVAGLFGTTGLTHQYAKYKAAQDADSSTTDKVESIVPPVAAPEISNK